MLKNAHDNGVEKLVIPGTTPQGFERILELCEKYENVYGAVGVHPEDLDAYNDSVPDILRQYLTHPKIVAVGEIGLDYYWDKSRIERQKEIFEQQILIAKEAKKPVLVHDREAHSDSFEILKKTYDLHSENIFGENIETEHEKMFSEQGIKIKALIAKLK